MKNTLLCALSSILLMFSCTETEPMEHPEQLKKTGSGFFQFRAALPSGARDMNVYYHIPENSTETDTVLIVLHGNGRDALNTRNVFTSLADEKGIIVIAPEFSNENFPGGDSYNLGNVFIDGDNPSENTLNDTADWTFAVIEPIFTDFKNKFGLLTDEYDLFGHSAGAQVAHRIALFLPGEHLQRVACSAAGWYTVPDNEIPFPYGLNKSPRYQADLSYFFKRDLLIMVGTADNDKDSPGLRHNEYADAQGLNRFDRAQHFYVECLKIAGEAGIDYNFQYFSVEGVDHDLTRMARFAVDRLYP